MVSFSSASTKDADSRITVNASDFGIRPSKGSEYYIKFKLNRRSYSIPFTCNRAGKSLKTTAWPGDLPLSLEVKKAQIFKVTLSKPISSV